MNQKILLMNSILMIILVIFLTCDSPNGPKNKPPIISNLSANPSQVEVGKTSILICEASDPDNDNLSYIWNVSNGTIIGSGSNVNWTAPNIEGIYNISCKVTDGNGGQDIDSVKIEVKYISGLVAYYPFNGNANDESGNGNHGTVMGNATVDDVLLIGDNNVDRLSLPHTTIDGLTDFTFSSRLKINTLHITGRIPGNNWISAARSANTNAFGFFYDPNQNAWEFSVNLGSGERGVFFYNDLIEDKNWHHIVILRSSSVARLFVDGVEVEAEKVVKSDVLDVDLGGFIIGQEQDAVDGNYEQDQSWAGEIDNFRIYNRAIEMQDILILFNEIGWGK